MVIGACGPQGAQPFLVPQAGVLPVLVWSAEFILAVGELADETFSALSTFGAHAGSVVLVAVLLGGDGG